MQFAQIHSSSSHSKIHAPTIFQIPHSFSLSLSLYPFSLSLSSHSLSPSLALLSLSPQTFELKHLYSLSLWLRFFFYPPSFLSSLPLFPYTPTNQLSLPFSLPILLFSVLAFRSLCLPFILFILLNLLFCLAISISFFRPVTFSFYVSLSVRKVFVYIFTFKWLPKLPKLNQV